MGDSPQCGEMLSEAKHRGRAPVRCAERGDNLPSALRAEPKRLLPSPRCLLLPISNVVANLSPNEYKPPQRNVCRSGGLIYVSDKQYSHSGLFLVRSCNNALLFPIRHCRLSEKSMISCNSPEPSSVPLNL